MNKELEKELNAMNTVIHEPASTDAPGTDTPGTDAPSTESASTDAPTTDAPEDLTTEAPTTNASGTTDAPSTEAPTTDAPDELTLLRQEIELLKAEKNKKPTTDAPGTKAPTTSTPTTEAPLAEVDFVSEIDLEELSRDPEALNTLLNNVFKKGIDIYKGITLDGNESVLKSIPDIVKSNLTLITNLKKASDQFYADNKDLEPWRQAVASVFEEVMSKNPENNIDDNLKITGDEVRKRLKLKEQTIKKGKKSPKLPANKGGPRPNKKPSVKGIESEIDAMNKSI